MGDRQINGGIREERDKERRGRGISERERESDREGREKTVKLYKVIFFPPVSTHLSPATRDFTSRG